SSFSSTFSFLSNETATTWLYTLSLHDALPILRILQPGRLGGCEVMLALQRVLDQREVLLGGVNPGGGLGELRRCLALGDQAHGRSEEHMSELQSRRDLVCRLLLEKKKKNF